jgi:hypothetical protein
VRLPATIRTPYILPATIRTPYIMGKFSFGKKWIGLTYDMVLHMHVHE